ncbi:MAG: helix-turn-helix transcriptional regulator [Deltaproteobacteria bacterium]|nr:helix-turn-helix transcriptional regulator [Deltaproteobacteria bacterium]
MPKAFDREVLRKRITETRKSHGMNQAELAEKAGVTPAAISQIEKGTRVPTIPVLHRIANVLGVSLDYLTGKTDTSELQDLLQHDDLVAFFRGFESLGSEGGAWYKPTPNHPDGDMPEAGYPLLRRSSEGS